MPKRSAEPALAPQKKPKRAAADLFDAETLAALRSAAEPFLGGTSPPLTDERVIAAASLVAGNHLAERFGVDGTGCELGGAAATALGSLRVQALVFPLELAFDRAGRHAFLEAVVANAALESLTLASTNVDGELVAGWSPVGSAFAADVQRRRKKAKLPELAVAGDEAFEEESYDEGEEESDGSDGDDDSCVQCDRRGCRRELTDPKAAVYTSGLGMDYCAACVAGFEPERRAALRKSTVADRLGDAPATSSAKAN